MHLVAGALTLASAEMLLQKLRIAWLERVLYVLVAAPPLALPSLPAHAQRRRHRRRHRRRCRCLCAT